MRHVALAAAFAASVCFPAAAASTKTFSTDAEFAFFAKENTVVSGSGADACVSLENRWTELVISGPSLRYWPAMAASSDTARVLLSGGRNQANPDGLTDFWIFSPAQSKWTQKSAAGSPSARYGHLASAAGGGKFLVFGGISGGGYLGDTRIYDADANTWSAPAFAVAPSSRAFAASAYDKKRNRVYLFGGISESGVLGDLWYYDPASESWNYVNQISTPSARSASAMVYLEKEDTVLLFGGDSGATKLRDLRHFSPSASSWTIITQQEPRPVETRYHAFIYDTNLSRAVLFGGDTADTPNITDKLWTYDISSNRWSSAAPLTSPPAARYASGAAFCGYNLIFGGSGPSAPEMSDTWKYVAASSGNFVSSSVSEYAPTGIRWQTLNVDPVGAPTDTQRKFQISASADGSAWTEFAGPNGDPAQYFSYAGIPLYLDYASWQNKPNLKIKCYMSSALPPQSPSVDKLYVKYNRPPYSPAGGAPSSGKKTDRLSPYFGWGAPSDPDGDPVVFYEMQISTSPQADIVFFSSAGIPGGGFATVTSTPGASLYEGAWYWRVRASDSEHYGAWSPTYDFKVDTTPPAAVAAFSAVRGNVNGAIFVYFQVSGDDGNSGNLANAACILKYATYPVVTEGDWASAPGSKTSAITFIPAGGDFIMDATGLADAVTYYFNARIRDEAGNLGALSAASPAARTNAPPAVSLTFFPQGVLSGDNTAEWSSSEPDADAYKHRVFISSDGGSSYGYEMSPQPLPSSATFYTVNTKRLKNGANYRLKIEARDEPFNLSSATTSGVFGVFNVNEPPLVEFLSPAASAAVSGICTLRWRITDANLCDSHSSEIKLSADGGATYGWTFLSTTDYYVLDTALMPNGSSYAAIVTVTDDGSPPLSGLKSSGVFSIVNENRPPGRFALVSPPDKKYRSMLRFAFSWQASSDPNPEDNVVYDLFYSTMPDFSGAVAVSGLAETTYSLRPSQLIPEATYYWKVAARDPFGATTASDAVFEFYALNRFKSSTDDNRLMFAALKGLPPDAFLLVNEVPSAANAAIQAADRGATADPFIKILSADKVYRVGFYDENLVSVEPSGEVEIEVVYDFSEPSRGPRKSHLMGAAEGLKNNLRIAVLDESRLRWRLASALPSSDNERIRSVIRQTGYVSLLAALSPTEAIMGLTNYPNPFNPAKETTHIIYTLTKEGDVFIKIYTLTGDLVRSIVYTSGASGARSQPSGYTNEIFWDGKNDAGMTAASGVYILEMTSAGASKRRKIGIINR